MKKNETVHGPFTSPEIELKKFMEEMKIKNNLDFQKQGYKLVIIEDKKRAAF